VARVLADDLHTPVAADHLALLTNLFDARSNLHVLPSLAFALIERTTPLILGMFGH